MLILLTKIMCALLSFLMAALTGFAVPAEKKCEAEFKGSFVQSWASGSWNDDQWESEMDYMKQCGIEYLIVQNLADKSYKAEGGGWTVYYDSKLPEFADADRSSNDVLEKALYHCQKAGIKLFVPLAMFDDFWTETAFTSQYYEICDISCRMAEEIYGRYYEGYEDTFCGWYFVPELSNNLLTSASLAGISIGLNRILDKLTELDGSLPLLLSPYYSRYYSTGPAVTLSALVAFFKMTKFRDGDIYCPQDAVGAGWTEPEDLKMMWRLYSEAVKSSKADVKLWANVECFTTPYADTLTDGIFNPEKTENTVYVPATLDRVITQMEIASGYAENIITFSFNHYYGLKFASPAFMETYKDYLVKSVLEKEAPKAVTGLTKNAADNGITLTWNEAEDNFGVVYYRIEKNGSFLARVETFAGGETVLTDESGSLSDIYTVTAWDAAGNASEGVTL